LNGTTDLPKSPLIISRSGPGIPRSHAYLASTIEKVWGMIHAHPDAASVQFSVHSREPELTDAVIDRAGMKIERRTFPEHQSRLQTRQHPPREKLLFGSADSNPNNVWLPLPCDSDQVVLF
jgi:hypothetical protein